jgi:putative membrane protein
VGRSIAIARCRRIALWLTCSLPALAAAHQRLPGAASDLPAPGSWSLQAWVVVLMLLALAGYGLGSWRVWQRAGWGRGVQPKHVAAFASGWLVLGAALVSPLDAMGAWLFSAHMVQHELLMIVAAPLLVLGRPLAAWTWAFAPEHRPGLRTLIRVPAVAASWRWITAPVAAWSAHALALWAWHVPAFFDAALQSEPIHILQHMTFLGTALLFWWAVLGGDRRTASAAPMVLLFTTMLHSSILGALLALASTPWYSPYAATSSAFGFTPLEDQQLGGLVMWIPGGLAYLVAGLALAARWLGRPPRESAGRPGTAPLTADRRA